MLSSSHSFTNLLFYFMSRETHVPIPTVLDETVFSVSILDPAISNPFYLKLVRGALDSAPASAGANYLGASGSNSIVGSGLSHREGSAGFNWGGVLQGVLGAAHTGCNLLNQLSPQSAGGEPKSGQLIAGASERSSQQQQSSGAPPAKSRRLFQ